MSTEKESKLNRQYIFWYFVIFSIIGLVVETLFGYATTGTIDSRKGLIWGPFCPIYGVGAIILIFFLQKYEKQNWKVFVYGGIIGGIIEYVISFILEAMYSSRFWDYSHLSLHLNGRICLKYTIYWSILSIALMKYIKPWIDEHIIEKYSKKKHFKIIEKILFIFLVVDAIVTVWAISAYKDRALDTYYNRQTEKEDSIIKNIEENYFSNKKMLKTFPNLRVQVDDGKEMFIRDILK